MDNKTRGQFQCDGCGLQLRLFLNGLLTCQACGGTMLLMHPMTIAWSDNDGVHYAQWAIDREVNRGLEMIYTRLAAEVEMDKAKGLWYNKEKRGQDGEEADDSDRVSL